MRNRPVPDISAEDTAFVRACVIHEDKALIAFDKPSGLPVQTRGNRGLNLDTLLWAFARSNGKRPKLVHRLDTGTSGVIVAAQTGPAAAHLSASFANRIARKTYLALAQGTLPAAKAGDIDQPLLSAKCQRGVPPVLASDAAGAVEAQTHWRILSRSGDTALFELHPRTGRMHQLRVHLRHLGCPILGDPFYGTGKLSAPRLMLHAARLSIPHPDGDHLRLEAPMPADMRERAMQAGLEVDTTSA